MQSQTLPGWPSPANHSSLLEDQFSSLPAQLSLPLLGHHLLQILGEPSSLLFLGSTQGRMPEKGCPYLGSPASLTRSHDEQAMSAESSRGGHGDPMLRTPRSGLWSAGARQCLHAVPRPHPGQPGLAMACPATCVPLTLSGQGSLPHSPLLTSPC